MMVYLHVEQGPHIGRRIDLRPGQIATIGKTDFADFNFEKDQQLADVQFRISVENDHVVLENLDADSETMVDGSPATKINLVNGNQIQCGQTIINVKIDDAIAPESMETATAFEETTEEDLDLLQLAKVLELSDEAVEMSEDRSDAQAFVVVLRDNELIADAIRLQAYLLPKTNAIFWVSTMIDDLDEINLSEEQQAAKESAVVWAKEPDEEKRRQCEKLAEQNNYSGIGGLLALTAFFSEGSIAPAGSEEDVLVDKNLSSQVLAGTIHTVVGDCPPVKSDELYSQFLDRAKDHSS